MVDMTMTSAQTTQSTQTAQTTQSTLDLRLNLSARPVPATRPPELGDRDRDDVKLLVLDRTTGVSCHTHFHNLADYFHPGDLLIVNTSAAIPARLLASMEGKPLYLHLSARLTENEFLVERRNSLGGPDARRFEVGQALDVLDPGTGQSCAQVTVARHFHPRSRLWIVRANQNLFRLAPHVGSPIHYSYVTQSQPLAAYQSIFSHHPGSAEMPSAARPFTHRVLRQLAAKGVRVRSLILHTGVSSHEVESDLRDHPVIPEWYHIPAQTARAVQEAKSQGRRIVAVGTTVVRALESSALTNGDVTAGSDWTTHLVTPSQPPQVVTSLLTGLHESQSSHLAMLYAFVHPSWLSRAYEEAVQNGYLWHEFGDTNLVF